MYSWKQKHNMFGIGFTEFFLIFVIAILFLGPDKLPQALVEMAKFIKGVKRTIGEAKTSLEEEINLSDLKEEALEYKKQLNNATQELKNFKNIDFDDLDKEIVETPLEDEVKIVATQVETQNSAITLTKKNKKENKA